MGIRCSDVSSPVSGQKGRDCRLKYGIRNKFIFSIDIGRALFNDA